MSNQREAGMSEARKLSRNETHDLSMIIKDRTRVLKAHVEHQSAVVLADFEKKIAAVYSFDQDEVWKRATERAMKVVAEAQREIEARCEEMGIPRSFAPRLEATWAGRGENASRERRAELRRVAKAQIEAMARECVLKIERQALDLRTQVVAMGLLSDEAKLFLESLAPVEEAMAMLDFNEVEKRLQVERESRSRRLRYGYED